MLAKRIVSICALAVMAAGTVAQAQEAGNSAIGGPPPKPAASQPAATPAFYRLDFVVKEVEGSRVLNTRTYSLIVSAGQSKTASVRFDTRVPFATSAQSGQFLNVGTSIDCNSIAEVNRDLSVDVTAEISSVSEPAAAAPGVTFPPPPVVRQNRWSSSVIVPLRKATVLFSSDDMTSKRQMQLELTAVPIM